MKYIDIDRKDLIKLIPATIAFVEQKDAELRSKGIELCFRDTDHVYDSLRLEFLRVDPQILQYDELRRIENNIIAELEGKCCKCGNNKYVTIEPYDNKSSSWYYHVFCADCKGSITRSLLCKYLFEYPLLCSKRKKAKFITKTGRMVYKFPSEVTILDNRFYIPQRDNPANMEEIFLIGADTYLRDYNDERVYEGDIILATNPDGQHFYGPIIKYPSDWKREPGKYWNTKFNEFSILHGNGVFHSALSWAEKIEIVGNVFQTTTIPLSEIIIMLRLFQNSLTQYIITGDKNVFTDILGFFIKLWIQSEFNLEDKKFV